VVVRSGQVVMSAAVRDFVDDLRYSDGDNASAVLVAPRRFAGVTLDPQRQHGRPAVRAVPTEVVAEQFRAGESAETIADLFDLTVEQVEQAIRFELSLIRAA
jgi:uncharacterized protein (DUF433 family)